MFKLYALSNVIVWRGKRTCVFNYGIHKCATNVYVKEHEHFVRGWLYQRTEMAKCRCCLSPKDENAHNIDFTFTFSVENSTKT